MKQIQEYLEALDKRMAEIRERNERRAQEAKAQLGTRYLLHPANHVKKVPRGSN